MDIFGHRNTRPPCVLTVPGFNNSGPAHWQTIWERERSDCRRVDLGSWSRPHRNSWVIRLNNAIREAGVPVILVAHSLGCLAVAWWAQLERPPFGHPVAGALLVAPPDVDCVGPHLPLAGFSPAPKLLLPFPSVLVASANDPYMPLARARNLAQFWGSHFVDIGEAGHINAESRLGAWPFGQALLDDMIDANGGTSPLSRYVAGFRQRSEAWPERGISWRSTA